MERWQTSQHPDCVKDVLEEPMETLLSNRCHKDLSDAELERKLQRNIAALKTATKLLDPKKMENMIKELKAEQRCRQLQNPSQGQRMAPEYGASAAVGAAPQGQVPAQPPPRHIRPQQGRSVGERQLLAAAGARSLPLQPVARAGVAAASQAVAAPSRTRPQTRQCAQCNDQVPVGLSDNGLCSKCHQAPNIGSGGARMAELRRPTVPKLKSTTAAAEGAAAGPSGRVMISTKSFYGQQGGGSGGTLNLMAQLISADSNRGNAAQQQSAPSQAAKARRGQQQQALGHKRSVTDVGDEDCQPAGQRQRAAGGPKQRGRRLALVEPDDKGPQEPIDLADSSDDEDGLDADTGQRAKSGSAAGPGPSSAAAAAAQQARGGVSTRQKSRDFQYLAVRLAGLKCCFPPEGGKHSVEVAAEDLARLEKGEFLNDTCIDFYIKHIEHHLSPELQGRYHFFNSFFLKKLQEKPAKPARLSKVEMSRQNHERVKKWTKHVDLFSKDYVFVPIHGYLHWSLVLICHPGNVVKEMEQYHAPGGPEPTGGGSPLLLHLDSLDGNHAPKGIFEALRGYLELEWARKAADDTQASAPRAWAERFQAAGQEPPRVTFTTSSLPGLSMSTRLPKQSNHTDCGLFLLSYMDFFVAANPKCIVISGAANANNVHALEPVLAAASEKTLMQKSWFQKCNAALLRDYLRSLICEFMVLRMAEEDERRQWAQGVVEDYKAKPCKLGSRYLGPEEYLKYVTEHPEEPEPTLDGDVLSSGSDGEEPIEDAKDVLQSPARRMTRAAAKQGGIKPTEAIQSGSKRRKVQTPAAGDAGHASQSTGGIKSVVDLSSPDKAAASSQPAGDAEGAAKPNDGKARRALGDMAERMELDGDEEDGDEPVEVLPAGFVPREPPGGELPEGTPLESASACEAGLPGPLSKRRKLQADKTACTAAQGTEAEAEDIGEGFGDKHPAAAVGFGAAALDAPAADTGDVEETMSGRDEEPAPPRRRQHRRRPRKPAMSREGAGEGDQPSPLDGDGSNAGDEEAAMAVGSFNPLLQSSQEDPETLPGFRHAGTAAGAHQSGMPRGQQAANLAMGPPLDGLVLGDNADADGDADADASPRWLRDQSKRLRAIDDCAEDDDDDDDDETPLASLAANPRGSAGRQQPLGQSSHPAVAAGHGTQPMTTYRTHTLFWDDGVGVETATVPVHPDEAGEGPPVPMCAVQQLQHGVAHAEAAAAQPPETDDNRNARPLERQAADAAGSAGHTGPQDVVLGKLDSTILTTSSAAASGRHTAANPGMPGLPSSSQSDRAPSAGAQVFAGRTAHAALHPQPTASHAGAAGAVAPPVTAPEKWNVSRLARAQLAAPKASRAASAAEAAAAAPRTVSAVAASGPSGQAAAATCRGRGAALPAVPVGRLGTGEQEDDEDEGADVSTNLEYANPGDSGRVGLTSAVPTPHNAEPTGLHAHQAGGSQEEPSARGAQRHEHSNIGHHRHHHHDRQRLPGEAGGFARKMQELGSELASKGGSGQDVTSQTGGGEAVSPHGTQLLVMQCAQHRSALGQHQHGAPPQLFTGSQPQEYWHGRLHQHVPHQQQQCQPQLQQQKLSQECSAAHADTHAVDPHGAGWAAPEATSPDAAASDAGCGSTAVGERSASIPHVQHAGPAAVGGAAAGPQRPSRSALAMPENRIKKACNKAKNQMWCDTVKRDWFRDKCRSGPADEHVAGLPDPQPATAAAGSRPRSSEPAAGPQLVQQPQRAGAWTSPVLPGYAAGDSAGRCGYKRQRLEQGWPQQHAGLRDSGQGQGSAPPQAHAHPTLPPGGGGAWRPLDQQGRTRLNAFPSPSAAQPSSQQPPEEQLTLQLDLQEEDEQQQGQQHRQVTDGGSVLTDDEVGPSGSGDGGATADAATRHVTADVGIPAARSIPAAHHIPSTSPSGVTRRIEGPMPSSVEEDAGYKAAALNTLIGIALGTALGTAVQQTGEPGLRKERGAADSVDEAVQEADTPIADNRTDPAVTGGPSGCAAAASGAMDTLAHLRLTASGAPAHAPEVSQRAAGGSRHRAGTGAGPSAAAAKKAKACWGIVKGGTLGGEDGAAAAPGAASLGSPATSPGTTPSSGREGSDRNACEFIIDVADGSEDEADDTADQQHEEPRGDERGGGSAEELRKGQGRGAAVQGVAGKQDNPTGRGAEDEEAESVGDSKDEVGEDSADLVDPKAGDGDAGDDSSAEFVGGGRGRGGGSGRSGCAAAKASPVPRGNQTGRQRHSRGAKARAPTARGKGRKGCGRGARGGRTASSAKGVTPSHGGAAGTATAPRKGAALAAGSGGPAAAAGARGIKHQQRGSLGGGIPAGNIHDFCVRQSIPPDFPRSGAVPGPARTAEAAQEPPCDLTHEDE